MLRQQKGFNQMQEVPNFPGLFIGPKLAAMDTRSLVREGITHVISTNGQSPFASYSSGGVSWLPCDGHQRIRRNFRLILQPIKVLVLHLDDDEEQLISDRFEESIDFIDDALQVSPLPASTHRTDTLSDRMAAKSWSFASLDAHGAQQLSARTSYPKRTATRWMQRS